MAKAGSVIPLKFDLNGDQGPASSRPTTHAQRRSRTPAWPSRRSPPVTTAFNTTPRPTGRSANTPTSGRPMRRGPAPANSYRSSSQTGRCSPPLSNSHTRRKRTQRRARREGAPSAPPCVCLPPHHGLTDIRPRRLASRTRVAGSVQLEGSNVVPVRLPRSGLGTSQGHPYAIFQRALRRRDLGAAWAAAHEVPVVSLADALTLTCYSRGVASQVSARRRKVAGRYAAETERRSTT